MLWGLLLTPLPALAQYDPYVRCQSASDAADYVAQSVYCAAAAQLWAEHVDESGADVQRVSQAKYVEATMLVSAASANLHLHNNEKAVHQIGAARRLFTDVAARGDASDKKAAKDWLRRIASILRSVSSL